MALKFRHIDTQQTLNTIKFSADSTNTTYFLHSSPSTQSQGVPDINYEDICFIKPTGQGYTHGKLYGGENDNKATALLDEYLNKTKLTHSLPQGGVVKGIILDGCEPSLNYNTNNQPNGYKISNGTIYLIGIGIIKVTGHRVHTPNESSEWFEVYGIHETSNTDRTTWDYHIYGQTFGPDYDSSILDEGQVANDVCRSLDLYKLYDLEVPIASDLQNGLMSKEDKIKLDNHTDEYLDYLHKLCTEHSKYAIILSGCTVEPTDVQNTYQRKGGYVYIDSINQIKKVNDGTISYSTTIEDSLYCNSQNGGNGKTYAFGVATNPSNLDNQYAKICDWSDLARLSDLEAPIATEYQNGLMSKSQSSTLTTINSNIFGKISSSSTNKSGSVDICSIREIMFGLDISGILVIAGIFQNGNIGNCIIAVTVNNAGISYSVLQKSSGGLLSGSNVVSFRQESRELICTVAFNATYTGAMNCVFIGTGKLQMLIN